MTALISVQDVMSRLGIADNLEEDVTPAITAAISAAQVRLESEIDTDILYGTGYARFWLDPTAFSSIQPDGGMYRCLLPQGFLRADEDVVVSQTDKKGANPVSILDDDFLVDRRRGIIFVDASSLSETYFSVAYSSGFKTADEVKAQETWLREALLAFVPLAMNAARTDSSEGGSGNAGSSSYRLKGDLAQGMVARYNRKLGLTLRPFISEWSVVTP